MFRISAAFAVLVSLPGPVFALPPESSSLTLDEAVARVAAAHPALRLYDRQRERLDAERDEAVFRPPLRMLADVENAIGTGDHAGIRRAEVSLSLSSVLERGGKREARQLLASARIDALALEREAWRLDLLAEVARRYLDLADAQARKAIAEEGIALRERTVQVARQRHRIGGAPESSALAAEAAVVRAQLAHERASVDAGAAWRRLALLWRGTDRDDPPATVGVITQLPDIPAVDSLLTLIDTTPALQRFADEARVREARLRLAETRRTPDIDWQVGVRRLQAEGDVALVAAIGIPLGSRARAETGVRAARAELAALSIEREVEDVALRAALLEAHGRYVGARSDVQRIDSELMPLLRRTEQAAEVAFRAGALPWLEWAQVQADIVSLQNERLASALDARRALIEIQRLTAQPFIVEAEGATGVTP